MGFLGSLAPYSGSVRARQCSFTFISKSAGVPSLRAIATNLVVSPLLQHKKKSKRKLRKKKKEKKGEGKRGERVGGGGNLLPLSQLTEKLPQGTH